MADYQFVHPQFTLNGFSFTQADLSRVAYAYSKEGDEYEQQLGLFLLNWFDESDTLELTTSGTTGLPKKIVLPKQAMVESAKATGHFFQLGAGTSAFLCMSVQFIAGKMMLVRAMQLGWQLDAIQPQANPLQKVEKPYDFAAMVPLQVANSLNKLSNINLLLIGGAPLPAVLRQQLLSLKINAFESYGMTETVTHIAVKSINESYFNALPGVQFSSNKNDCLCVIAPRISTLPVETKDIVKLINETQFEFMGRADSVINSGGVKLFPELIEQKLESKIPQRYYIIGKPDATWGEKVVLVIEGNPYELPPSVFSALGKFEKPKEVLFIPTFQETPTAKVIRLLPD
jgi:O-succinylbenzoic acid--CoA ligase